MPSFTSSNGLTKRQNQSATKWTDFGKGLSIGQLTLPINNYNYKQPIALFVILLVKNTSTMV